MNKEQLFEEIDEIYSEWNGGCLYIGDERENRIKELLSKAINYTRCCGALKKEETAFDLWLKNFKKTTYGYWYDENTIYCKEAMRDVYKNEVKPTL